MFIYPLSLLSILKFLHKHLNIKNLFFANFTHQLVFPVLIFVPVLIQMLVCVIDYPLALYSTSLLALFLLY
jgi:hypothetical protein